MKWISVDERLPEIGQKIDIYCRWDGRVPDVKYKGDGEWVADYMRWSGSVSHWMVIEPPERGQG